MKNKLSQTIKPLFKSKPTMASLNIWNQTMAALNFLQGVIILVLSSAKTFPVTTNYLTRDSLASQVAGHPVLSAATKQLFDVNPAYLIAAFFFISAIAHVLIATIYRKKYEADLKNGINRIRWLDYGFSAGTMILAIALLTGIYDLSTLALVFSLTLIMNLLGLIMEVHNQKSDKTCWYSFIVSCIAGAMPWIVFLIYIIGAGVYGEGHIPTFIYWIYISLFVLFGSFAVNMFLQYKKKGKWANYLYVERVYMVLSLVAKTALAWQIFAGLLRT